MSLVHRSDMIPDGGGSPTSGSRDTGCRADAGRGGGGKERGGKGPLGTNDVHGRVTAGRWSCRMRSSMEEGRILGGDQNPHGLGSKPTWATTRRLTTRSALPLPSTGKCHTTIYDPGAGHDLHRRPSRHQADGIGRAWPRPEVCAPGTKTHRHTAAIQTGNHHRDPVVPSTQRGARK